MGWECWNANQSGGQRNNHQAGIGCKNNSAVAPHLDGFPHEAVAGLVRAGEV